MIILSILDRVLIILISVLISLVLSLWFFSKEPPQRIAVVDLTKMSQDFIFDLATGDLEEGEVAKKTEAWSEDLLTRINQIAEKHNLIVIPSEIGVHGPVINITHLLE